MLRYALPCLLLLAGCVSNTGFPEFMSNTQTFSRNPNMPPGDALNMRRVEAANAPFEPIGVEPGTVWPGPPAQIKSLRDLQIEQDNGTLPPVRNIPQPGSPNRPQKEPMPGLLGPLR